MTAGPLVLQHTALVGKCLVTPLATRLANTTVVDAAKGKIGMYKVHHRLVDAGVTSTGLFQAPC